MFVSDKKQEKEMPHDRFLRCFEVSKALDFVIRVSPYFNSALETIFQYETRVYFLFLNVPESYQ